VIGELAFDQSAVPKAEHLRESNLRRKLAALAEAGEVASMPKLQAITEAVRSAFEDAGVGPVTVEVARQPRGEVVRVDLTFRVAGGEV
jgi:outer membrane protein assembly factor BamA